MSGADGGSVRDLTMDTSASAIVHATEGAPLPAALLPRPYQAEAARLGAAALRQRGTAAMTKATRLAAPAQADPLLGATA